MHRRTFLKTASTALPLTACLAATQHTRPAANIRGPLKLSCNLYSFNSLLRDGQMTLEQVLAFCSDLGFDAVDPTGYYFPGYPDLPPDAYVFEIKRKAFRLGLDISGTGVRNDFTLADPQRRREEVELVRRWTGFAARLGAPVLRVFAGRGLPEGQSDEEVNGWVADALRECAEYAAGYGVMIVLQNHAEFIRDAGHLLHILRMVDSEWLAVNLDIGSFPVGDPYAQIAQVAPYAATWQIKENVTVNGEPQKTDLEKIVRIVHESGYRGYLPIETLGPGDPRRKVPLFLDEVRKAFA